MVITPQHYISVNKMTCYFISSVAIGLWPKLCIPILNEIKTMCKLGHNNKLFLHLQFKVLFSCVHSGMRANSPCLAVQCVSGCYTRLYVSLCLVARYACHNIVRDLESFRRLLSLIFILINFILNFIFLYDITVLLNIFWSSFFQMSYFQKIFYIGT